VLISWKSCSAGLGEADRAGGTLLGIDYMSVPGRMNSEGKGLDVRVEVIDIVKLGRSFSLFGISSGGESGRDVELMLFCRKRKGKRV